MQALKPARLKRGDVIGLIAPASAPSAEEKISKGIRYLEDLGYRVKVAENARAKHGYLAGTDAQRIADLNGMLRDPQVKAIFALRGGYGTPRLLPFVDYAAVRRQPKILVGYSDLTGLQMALYRKTGLVTFSGPMPAVEFWKPQDASSEEHFWRVVTSTKRVGKLLNPADAPLRTIHAGVQEGPLLGGNLSLIVSSLGTPYTPTYRGAVLALEDIDEEPYRLDRMFTHLRNAGILKNLHGLLMGHCTGWMPSDPTKPMLKLDEMLAEVYPWVKAPTVENFQYGHIPCKVTLPLGLLTRVDSKRREITVLESAVV